MTRRPNSATALFTPMERAWAAIQKVGLRGEAFSAWDVQDACAPMVLFPTVAHYLRNLARAGYLGEAEPSAVLRQHGNRHSTPRYVLLKNAYEAPRVGVDGKPALQGMGVLAMWRAMRALKSFDSRAIASAATVAPVKVSETTARMYVASLHRAGYLHQLRAPTRQVPGLYRLIRFTGPHAPAITRARSVLDRNTGELLIVETAQEVCDGIK